MCSNALRAKLESRHTLVRSLPDPLIVMPARNEAESVGAVIREIRSQVPFPVLVVDDASTDDTRALAESQGAIVIRLINRLGAWGATQTGMRYASRHGYTTVITVDADGQHDPARIKDMLAVMQDGAADVCIGAWTSRGSHMRHVAWRLLRLTSGLRIEDLTSGFRVYNETAINILSGWRATFLDFQDIGVLSLLLQNKVKIADIETPMRPRRNGHSRVFNSWLVVGYYMCHSVLLGLTKRPVKHLRPRR